MESGNPFAPSRKLSLEHIDEVQIGRGASSLASTTHIGARNVLVIQIQDPWMSSSHAVLSRSGGDWFALDSNSKNGVQVNGSAVRHQNLRDEDILAIGNTLFLFRSLPSTSMEFCCDTNKYSTPYLSSFHPPLQRSFAELGSLSETDIPILLLGETGTGKEAIAHAIHRLSQRKGSFVAINCGAIPESLIESELFGHKKGSFSGAIADRSGLVATAEGGTLFLDEIADMPMLSQVRLLRVLQQKEILPIGARVPQSIDVRFVGATNHNISDRIRSGNFRQDLFSRIAGATFHLPSLRRRREDLGAMIATVLRRSFGTSASEIRFHREAVSALLQYEWPQNIRQLEHVLKTAAHLAGPSAIRCIHLPQELRMRAPRTRTYSALSRLDQQRRTTLLGLLRTHKGNISAVARSMNTARVQVRRWCQRYEIQVAAFRS